MTQSLHLDFETYSEINIKTQGLDVYCRHHSTEALLLSWKIDNTPTELWDIKNGDPMPAALYEALFNPEVKIHAFNARFERLILKFCLGYDLPINRFRCSQVLAYALSFKGSLGEVLDQAGFPKHLQKLKEGKNLIDRFCKPQKHLKNVYRWDRHNDPEGWQQFKAYCIQDTDVEYALEQWLIQFEPMSDWEWKLYVLDQRINDRGAPVDLELCKQAGKIHQALRKNIKAELKKVTGLENPLSNAQMRSWLETKNYPLPNLKEETVLAALDTLENTNTEVHYVLSQYHQATRTAGTKWKAFLQRANEDGRVRGAFQFAGAGRTRRWAGRGVQLHNLRHGPVNDTVAEVIRTGHAGLLEAMYEAPMDILASSIRAAITAPEGRSLVVSDLTSIESVVLGHLAGCQSLEEIYREGKDAYRVFAQQYFGIPYEQVTKAQRNFSKPPVLGCGYGLGWKGLIAYAKGYGVTMSKQEAERAVDTFRESYSEIPDMWYGLLEGIESILNQSPGIAYERFKVRVYRNEFFLFIELPSGRRLAYYQPAWEIWDTPIGEKMSFTYMGVDRYTLRWTRIAAHGGLVVENVVQAVARDILAHGMTLFDNRVMEASWDDEVFLVAHVHDEPIAEANEERADAVSRLLKECITVQPDWLPDIWLGAGGWIGKRYRKD